MNRILEINHSLVIKYVGIYRWKVLPNIIYGHTYYPSVDSYDMLCIYIGMI